VGIEALPLADRMILAVQVICLLFADFTFVTLLIDTPILIC